MIFFRQIRKTTENHNRSLEDWKPKKKMNEDLKNKTPQREQGISYDNEEKIWCLQWQATSLEML